MKVFQMLITLECLFISALSLGKISLCSGDKEHFVLSHFIDFNVGTIFFLQINCFSQQLYHPRANQIASVDRQSIK